MGRWRKSYLERDGLDLNVLLTCNETVGKIENASNNNDKATAGIKSTKKCSRSKIPVLADAFWKRSTNNPVVRFDDVFRSGPIAKK